ncbi:MAG: helix-turn-helix transcriptional regulator [Ktedonobacteraceae bacterium]
MAKSGKAPKGFYSATEVMKKLGIASSTLYHYVETGKVKRVVPPDKRDGYYIKSEIDKMVRAKELFMLQYATDTAIFEQAQEEDVQGITDLGVELFGKSGSPSYETRLAQYHANPEMFYVLKQDDLIVGYILMFPLKQEAIEKIMSGVAESTFRTGLLIPENIQPFKPGTADHVFMIIGVRQGLAKSRIYGARVISGAVEVFEHFARKGIIIKKLYGTSRTQEGIKLAKDLGFKRVTPVSEEDNLLRFELDLATAKEPIFKTYQSIVKRATAASAKK